MAILNVPGQGNKVQSVNSKTGSVVLTGEDIKTSSGATATIKSALDDKFDKSGGTVSGATTVSGKLTVTQTGESIVSSGLIVGARLKCTANIAADSIATGDLVPILRNGQFYSRTQAQFKSDIGVTGKQDALTTDQLTAVNSGITSTLVTTIKTTAAKVSNDLPDAIARKQDKLSTAQLAAADSGVTADKVKTYDGYATQIASKQDAGDYATNSTLTTELAKKLDKTGKATSAGTADSATKATQDGSGNIITSTYATVSSLSEYAKKTDLTNVYRYKSTVASLADLPTSGQTAGDTYNVEAQFTYGDKVYPAGTNVAWNGTAWDPLGGTVDLSPYQTKAVGTASRALITNGSGNIAVSDITSTELGYLDGVTSNVQTQITSVKTTADSAKTTADAAIPQGGTLSKPLKVTGGDSATAGKLSLDNNNKGQITDSSTATLIGFMDTTTLTLGSTSYKTNVRGSSVSINGVTVGNLSVGSASKDGSGNNIVATYATKTELSSGLDGKQDSLTAGDNITISEGKISAVDTKYTLPTATSTVLGGIKIGSGLSISGGTVSVTGKQSTLSTAQLNACNSGITSAKVTTYDGYATTLANKQNKLTAGTGVTISSDNVISVSAGIKSVVLTEKRFSYTTTGSSTTTYTLSGLPSSYLLDVYINGLMCLLGTDYTVSGSTVTFKNKLNSGQQCIFIARYVRTT